MKTYDIITSRRSIRHYKQDEIPESTLRRLLLSMRAAPSAKNRQPWKVIVVKNVDRIQELGQYAVKKYKFFQKSPVIMVACGYPDKAFDKLGGHTNCVEVDVAIALDHLILCAWEERIGTCWIGEFDEAEAKKVLKVPGNVSIVAMVTMGFPDDNTVFETPNPKSRRDLYEIVSYEEYSD